MNYGFVIDNRKCIGCHACTVACKSEHDVPIGVNRTHVKYVEKGVFPQTRRTFTVTRCNHCADAPCVEICPTSALFTRRDGIVDFDSDRCIACKSCMQACPYDALYIDPATQTAAKCNYCAHRIENGYEPACVIVCPVEAIVSGDLDDPFSSISSLLSRQQVTVRKPEKNTEPKLFYIDGDYAALNPLEAERRDSYLFTNQAAGVGHFAHFVEDRLSVAADNDLFLPDDNPPGGDRPRSGGMTLAGGAISVSQRAVDDVRREIENAEPASARRVYDSPDKGVLWGWEVSSYIWTKAIATGTFLMLTLAGLLGGPLRPPAFSAALLVSLFFMGLTGALLVYDLDQPGRFLYVLLRPNWRSWLVRGAYIISAFAFIVTAILLAHWQGWTTWVTLLQIPGAILAVLGSTYTAFLFAQARGRDLWQSPLSALRMLNHALMAGAAVIMIADSVSIALMTQFLRYAVVLNLAILVLEVVTPHSSRDAARAVEMMTRGFYRFYFFGGIVLGSLLPLLLFWIVASPLLLVVGGILVVCGIFLTEYVWVRVPQLIPLA